MEALIEWGLPPHKLVFILSSVVAFAWLPAGLGKWLWGLIVWFVVLNVVFLLPVGFWTPQENPWIFLLLCHGFWLAILADFIFKGKLGPVIQALPYRQILLFEVSRLMAFHFLLAARSGDAPLEFAVEAALGEILTGTCALVLYTLGKNPGVGFRMGLLVWNTYGLSSLVAIYFKLHFSNPFLERARFTREIFQFMTESPEAWMPFFWMPLGIAIHLSIYYKLVQERLKPEQPVSISF